MVLNFYWGFLRQIIYCKNLVFIIFCQYFKCDILAGILKYFWSFNFFFYCIKIEELCNHVHKLNVWMFITINLNKLLKGGCFLSKIVSETYILVIIFCACLKRNVSCNFYLLAKKKPQKQKTKWWLQNFIIIWMKLWYKILIALCLVTSIF